MYVEYFICVDLFNILLLLLYFTYRIWSELDFVERYVLRNTLRMIDLEALELREEILF